MRSWRILRVIINRRESSRKKKRKANRRKALFAVGLVCILWGTTWMASKIGVKHIPALQLSGLRHLIGGGLYVAYFSFVKKVFPQKHQWWRLLWMSLLMFVLSNGLSVLSVVYMPSGLGSVVGAIAPIWVIVFSFIIFKHIRFKKQTIAGILLGFAGVIITFADYFDDLLSTNFSLGLIFGMISSMTWAVATLLTVKQAKDMDPYFSLGWQMFISGLILNTYSYVSGNFVNYVSIPTEAWFSIAYLVVIGSVIAFGAYIFALKRLPATLVSIHAYINPIVAILLGDLLMNEELTPLVVAGTIITLLGVYLVNNSFKRKIKFRKSSPATAD
jgi:drug/metabolite transporter (DMT)-like permease